MTTAQDYFTHPGMITALGDHAALFKGLPRSIDQLRRTVQGLMIHIFWADQYGVQLAPERREEVQLRVVTRQLDRLLALDPSPLTQARPPERRLVGNCRDFSTLLTAMLRHQGVPARARCGFARYFAPDEYVDHWVCEYWNEAEQRWILVDAQLDELQCDKLSISFDPLDVPRDHFIVGGRAWQLCRRGEADPNRFGIFDMRGLWFVRGNFVRDVASLNKVELLPWDSWGIIEGEDESLSVDDLHFLDQLADLTYGDVPDLDAVRQLYETNPRLRVPEVILSYTEAGVREVALAGIV